MKYGQYVVIITLILIFTFPLFSANAKESVTIDQKAPQKIERINAPFEMPQLSRPVFRNQTFNITKYGAKGDGITKNTNAFKKAIEACSKAGGGKVIVPKGKWLTGAIHLKSNVNLHFKKGAELHFSTDPNDYLPVVFTRWAGFELYNYSPLIYARDCNNIAITGPGKLYGHGASWWKWENLGVKTCLTLYHDKVLKGVPPEERIYGTEEAGLRPQFINPVNCKNVLLEGFTIAEPGPFWTIQFVYCENVIVRSLRLHTVGGPNTDGVDFDSTKNALIEYCYINAGDDCVALKSGINEDGRRVGRPTENIVIRKIKGLQSHGGIVVGSDTSGDVRNIFAHDCDFEGADRGIRLKSNASRGGVVENLWYQDINMTDIAAEAIVIDTNYGAWMANENGNAYPTFRNICIKNVTCKNAKVSVSIAGTSHKPIQNITMENVFIKSDTGMKFEWVQGLKMINVVSEPANGEPKSFIECKDVLDVPLKIDL